jgi:prepilin-type processing-associated H-X9-DG protein
MEADLYFSLQPSGNLKLTLIFIVLIWVIVCTKSAESRVDSGNPRHQDKANVVFCDGHVESPTLQFLFEDTSDAALARWNRDHLPHREKLSP